MAKVFLLTMFWPTIVLMVNAKNNRPDRHWALLKKLASTHGTLTFAPLKSRDLKAQMSQLDAHIDTGPGGFRLVRPPDRTVKQKHGLSKALRNFFHLKDNPIEWNQKESCYRASLLLSLKGNELDELDDVSPEGVMDEDMLFLVFRIDVPITRDPSLCGPKQRFSQKLMDKIAPRTSKLNPPNLKNKCYKCSTSIFTSFLLAACK